MSNIYCLLNKKDKTRVKIRHFNKGQIIFHEGDICEYVSIVLKGEIAIASYSFSGNEIIYNLLKEDDMFGNNLLFSSEPKYKGHVIAKTMVTLVLIKKDDLLYLLQNNRSFLEKYLNYQSDFGKELNAKIKLLSFDNAEERFLYYLYIHNNKITYQSITQLAASLFLKRETTSRLIHRLIKEGKIALNKKEIELIK